MDAFWGMPAGTDLAVPAEVKVSVDGTSVAEKITLVASGGGGYHVKAAKKFKKGDLILAEMALCFVEGPVAGKVDPLDVLRRTRFVGPFSSAAGRPAAIRVAAQLPVWRRAAAKDAAGLTACSRAQLLASALSAHGFRCTAPSKWLKGDKAGDEGPRVTRSGAGASALPVPADATSGERPAELSGTDDEHDKDGHCLFLRGSLFRHSCEPTAAVQVRFDRVTGAPALYVIARGDLAAGAEVTISYLPDTSAPLSRRQHLLGERYGFACACARCSLPYDDTVALRCASCPGPVRVRSAGDKAADASPASDAASAERSACSAAAAGAVDGEEEAAAAATRALQLICAACGAECDTEVLAQRASALHALDVAVAAVGGVGTDGSAAGPDAAARHVDTALAAFKAVHHAADTHFLVRAHLLLHRLVQPTRMLARKAPAEAAAASTSPAAAPPAGGSPAAAVSPVPESAVELSALVLAAASSLPYLDPYLLLDVAVDHGLLCGMAGCGERGAEAWRLAAQLATEYNPLGTALHELFESFGRKPPRTALEAATAARMRRVAEDALGL